MAHTLAELARHIGAELQGDPSCLIHAVAALPQAGPGEVSFLTHPRYRKHLASTRASAVILDAAHRAECPVSALVVENPLLAYARAAALLYPEPLPAPGIHPGAVVSGECRVHASASVGAQCVLEQGVEIGPNVVIGPGCVIGRDSIIGAGSRLLARVTLCHGTRIGKRALIHPGAVIGSDGFGLAPERGAWVKIPQLGRVCIGDDVEIGANTAIDRGALEDTVIEDGVKLDNQIHIAHNVRIGAHTAIAACVGIAGGARIGKRCQIGGCAGIAGHIEITDDVIITGMAMVTKSITKRGVYSSGIPAQENALWHKQVVRLRQLEDITLRLKKLENRLLEK